MIRRSSGVSGIILQRQSDTGLPYWGGFQVLEITFHLWYVNRSAHRRKIIAVKGPLANAQTSIIEARQEILKRDRDVFRLHYEKIQLGAGAPFEKNAQFHWGVDLQGYVEFHPRVPNGPNFYVSHYAVRLFAEFVESSIKFASGTCVADPLVPMGRFEFDTDVIPRRFCESFDMNQLIGHVVQVENIPFGGMPA